MTTEPTVWTHPPNQDVNGLAICWDPGRPPGQLSEAQRGREPAYERGGPGSDERPSAEAEEAQALQPKLVELSAGSVGLYSQPIQPAYPCLES